MKNNIKNVFFVIMMLAISSKSYASADSDLEIALPSLFAVEDEFQDYIARIDVISALPEAPAVSEPAGDAFCRERLSALMLLQEKRDGLYESEPIEEISYACDDCNQSFNRTSTLKRHRANVHAKIRYRCHLCEKSYSQGHHLDRHIENVHGEQKYVCSLCNTKFSLKSHLTRHCKRAHEGVKVGCRFCDKNFTGTEHLLTHVRNVHEGARDACPLCVDTFANTRKLEIHLEKVHHSIRYPCSACLKNYASKKNLKKHVRMKHPEMHEAIPKRQRRTKPANNAVPSGECSSGLLLSAEEIAGFPIYTQTDM